MNSPYSHEYNLQRRKGRVSPPPWQPHRMKRIFAVRSQPYGIGLPDKCRPRTRDLLEFLRVGVGNFETLVTVNQRPVFLDEVNVGFVGEGGDDGVGMNSAHDVI